MKYKMYMIPDGICPDINTITYLSMISDLKQNKFLEDLLQFKFCFAAYTYKLNFTMSHRRKSSEIRFSQDSIKKQLER